MSRTEHGGGSASDLRRAILDTTRHLLVRDGYQRLSMRRIAKEAGYSATSIYLHFKDKNDLFHTLIEEGMDHLYQVFQEITAQHPDDPIRRLEALCRGFIRFGLENPEYYEIMFLLHPERMDRYPAEKYRRARRNLDVIAATLEDGRAQGLFDVQTPRVTASAAWSALHGAVSLLIAQRIDVRIDRDAFIEAAIRQAMHSVTMPAAPALKR